MKRTIFFTEVMLGELSSLSLMQSADCKLKNLQVRKKFIEHKTITKRGKNNKIRGSVRNTFSPSSCGFKFKLKLKT